MLQYLENHSESIQSWIVDQGLKIIAAIAIYFIGIKIIKWVRKIIRKSFERSNADMGVYQFIDSLVKIGLYAVLFSLIGTRFGLTGASIIAVLGSVGLAIGLSLQGSLSNFAGGILILILRPFKVGDYIIEDSYKNEGTVIEIQIFYTKLMTPDHKTVIIPNGTLSNTSLTNVTNLEMRRVSVSVGISYDSNIKQAKKIIEELINENEKTLIEEPIEVFVEELGESAVVLTGRMWTLNDDYFPAKWQLTEEIKEAFDAASIEIPFNQMVLHISENQKEVTT